MAFIDTIKEIITSSKMLPHIAKPVKSSSFIVDSTMSEKFGQHHLCARPKAMFLEEISPEKCPKDHVQKIPFRITGHQKRCWALVSVVIFTTLTLRPDFQHSVPRTPHLVTP